MATAFQIFLFRSCCCSCCCCSPVQPRKSCLVCDPTQEEHQRKMATKTQALFDFRRVLMPVRRMSLSSLSLHRLQFLHTSWLDRPSPKEKKQRPSAVGKPLSRFGSLTITGPFMLLPSQWQCRRHAVVTQLTTVCLRHALLWRHAVYSSHATRHLMNFQQNQRTAEFCDLWIVQRLQPTARASARWLRKSRGF